MRTRSFASGPAPHQPPATNVQRMMGEVLLALVPGIAAHAWYFGPGILVQALIAIAAGLLFEAAMLRTRRRSLRPFLSDLSVPVTALLYVLCLPPLMPWWTTVIGMFFAVVLAKHLYGGLGHNVFNPAMVGYVAILVSFPREATAWLAPGDLAAASLTVGETVRTILTGALPPAGSWDALTAATPLEVVRSGVAEGRMLPEINGAPVFGALGGRGWEVIAMAYGVGGAWLLWRRIISWHVPAAMLGTIVLVTLPFFAIDPDTHLSPLAHVVSGGVVLGAFFIATDPVSGSTTPRGRLVFGVGVALLTLAIRRWGGYPDGVAFAVLLMNLAVPLIDRTFRPRVFGRS